MLSEREQAIKNILIDQVGGPTSYTAPRKSLSRVDPSYLEMAARRMSVNRRRMVIFAVLYALVVMTAVAVMTLTVKNFNVLLWVGVGTFNAVNAAIHYAEYQKKKMAFAVFDVLGQDEE